MSNTNNIRIFKPSVGVTIRYSVIYILFFIIISLFSFKGGFSWIVILLMFLAVLSVVFLLRNRISRIEVNSRAECITLYYQKFFSVEVKNFSLRSADLGFVEIKGARGMTIEIFRFKDEKNIFDMHFGLNGWNREKLAYIQDEVNKQKKSLE